MSNLANKTIELTDEEIVALASLGLLDETPTGYHLAKDALGFIVNTPDTGSGGASAFTDLTDKASADLPTINTPLANALATYQLLSEKNEVSGYPGLEVTPNGELKLFQNGLGSPQPQYQIDRIHRRDLPPTVDDDETQGYLEEDFYIVKFGAQRGIWVCLDTTVGAAVWQKLNMPTWWDVIVGASAKATPVAVTGGDVVEHTYEGIPLYRFIPSPSDPTLDNFYATFDGTDVSDLVIKRVP